MFFLPAAQFEYRKDLGCTDALLTVSHNLQKSLDVGIESYIVQQYCSTAFDRVSHSGRIFKLKSIGVGGSVLSICIRSYCSTVSQSFQACYRKVCWVLFCSCYILAKCWGWLRTDYMPMQMTPHYWQLIANQYKVYHIWTKGSILIKIIGTYKSEMPGNSAGNYVKLWSSHL